MSTYSQNSEREDRNVLLLALLIAFFVHAFLFLFMWFQTMTAVPPLVQGLMINFGDVEVGQGESAPNSSESENVEALTSDDPAEDQPEPPQTEEAVPNPSVEQEVEKINDVESVALPTEKRQKKEDADEKPKDKDREAASANEKTKEQEEKEREIDPQTLFKKRNNKSENTSQGSTTDPNGDQGNVTDDNRSNQQSDVYTPSRNIGMSDDGSVLYDLQGRNLLKVPSIKDNSQQEGKVVVKIKVDNTGKVIGADFQSKGSSTTNSVLKNLAIKAALESKFNFDPNAAAVQTGTMTFNFKVK